MAGMGRDEGCQSIDMEGLQKLLQGLPCRENMEPCLQIVQQPRQRGMRFRYECEGRSAGSIPGENSTDTNRTFPAVQILNYKNRAKIRVSLVTKSDPPKPHPHSLVGRDCRDGVCEMDIGPDSMIASFSNLGIQCVRRREIMDSLQLRLKKNVDPFKVGNAALDIEDMDLSVVRLCFEAFVFDSAQNIVALPPVVSQEIRDRRSTSTSELKICRVSQNVGSVRGGDEIFLLCDKVQREDIEVRFFDNNGWEARGVFSQTDVHRQVAIVFTTPPYHDTTVMRDVTVQMQLRRPSDNEVSDSMAFRYLPYDYDPYGINIKRRCPSNAEKISTFRQQSGTASAAHPVKRFGGKLQKQQHQQQQQHSNPLFKSEPVFHMHTMHENAPLPQAIRQMVFGHPPKTPSGPQAMVDRAPSGQYSGVQRETRPSAPPPQPTPPEASLSGEFSIKNEFDVYNPYDSTGMDCTISWSEMLKNGPVHQLFDNNTNVSLSQDLETLPIAPLTPDTQPGILNFSHTTSCYPSPKFVIPQQQQQQQQHQQQQFDDCRPPDFSTVQLGSQPARNLSANPAETPQSQFLPCTMSPVDQGYVPNIEEDTVSMVNFDSTEFVQLLSNIITDDSHASLPVAPGGLFVNGGQGQNQF